MKHKGSQFIYAAEMRQDLYRAFKETLYEHLEKYGRTNTDSVIRDCLKKQPKRFWASEDQVLTYISNINLGRTYPKMTASKREMYMEIHARVLALQRQHPGTELRDLICQVCEQPAPHFYFTFDSARIILYRILRERKQNKWNNGKN